MYCQMCGNKLPDGARACPVCGAQIQPMMQPQQQPVQQQAMHQQTQPVQQQAMQPQQQPIQQQPIQQQAVQPRSQKTSIFANKKTSAVIIISAITIFLALGVLFFVKLFYTPTVRLDKYVTIETKGYSSVGTAYIDFDEDSFYKDFDNSIRFKSGGPSDADKYYNAAECLYKEFLVGEFDKDTNISNGETIKYTWCIDEDSVQQYFKVKLEAEDISYTVGGLTEAETFDIFQDITVEFDGSAPQGTVRIYNDSNTYPVSNWTFVADKAEGLSNGDKINVYVEDVDTKIKECVDELGKIPSATTKEFEVSGLITAATSINQIPEDTMNQMKKTVEDGLTAKAASDWYDEISLDGMTYVGAFFLKAKPESNAETENKIKLVYTVDTSINREDDKKKITGTYGYYYFGEFSNLTLNEDGTCEVDLNSCSIPGASAVFSTESRDYYFDGYDEYKTLFAKEVTAYGDRYDYESTVNETVKPVEENVDYKDTETKKDNKKNKTSKKKDTKTSSDGQVCPESSTRYLTDDEVKKLTDEEIQTAINEIYARNGYKFQDQGIYDYFKQYSWYKPKSGSQDDVKRKFSDIENKNVELLQKYR